MAKITSNEQEVIVRRSPRYLRFFIMGIVLGLIVALGLTVGMPVNGQYSLIQIFGFVALISCAVGGAFGLVAALVLDRVMSKKTVRAIAEHEKVDEK